MTTKWVQPGIEISLSSIIETDIATQDTDERGYLIQDGTERSLYWASSPLGQSAYLVMATNGDDVAVTEDNIEDIAHDMSDAPRKDTAQGYQRLLDACKILGDGLKKRQEGYRQYAKPYDMVWLMTDPVQDMIVIRDLIIRKMKETK